MDKKGVGLYLLVTFGLGWAAQIGGLYAGFIVYEQPSIFHTLFFLAVMWIPALGALAVFLMVPRKDFSLPQVWPLPAGPAVRIVLAVFLVFVINYLMAGLLGFATPQWHLSSLFNQLDPKTMAQISPNVMGVLPAFFIVAGFLASLLLGASVFAAAALGSELGWRGCLLPRLAAANRPMALVVTSLFWGLWFLPITVGRHMRMPDDNSMAVSALCGLATVLLLGIVLGRVVLDGRHLGLAALLLGGFVGQQGGMWQYLFPGTSLPWAGALGVFGLIGWALLALFPQLMLGRIQKTKQQQKPADTPIT